MSRQSELAQLGRVFDNSALSNRNKIINGAMVIDQRNSGAAVTHTAYQQYATDRCSFGATGFSTLVATIQQVSDAPTGFSHSLKTTVTTAEATGASSVITAADFRIEGYDFADMSFGTASAKTFTLSFWVKASIAGTYCVSFFNAGVTRAYLAAYTISSANTWEYKTITVAGDTSGTWNTTNSIGLGIQFNVGAGSNQEGTEGAWSGTYKNTVSGSVDLNATTNATWQITGVQLEVGDTATPFEHRSYGQELALAQRFYVSVTGIQQTPDTNHSFNLIFPVEMRSAPSVAITLVSGGGSGSATAFGPISAIYSPSGATSKQNIRWTADAEL